MNSGVGPGAWSWTWDFRRDDTASQGAPTSTFQDLRFEEKVGLRNSAFILDPRLVILTFGGTFELFQEGIMPPREATRWDDGRLISYDVAAYILRERPYALTLFANRSMSRISREFAGTSDVESENMGVTLNLRNPYFPSSLSFRRELSKEETRLFGGVAQRDEARLITTYSGRRDWEASDLDIRYTFTDLDNILAPALAFQSHDMAARYRLTFGEEVEKTWTSGLQLFRREGLAPSTLLSADETLNLQHTETFSTGYNYRFFLFDAEPGLSTSHSGSFSLGHQLYESLSSSLGLSGTFTDQPQGESKGYGGSLSLGYTKRILGGGGSRPGRGPRRGPDPLPVLLSLAQHKLRPQPVGNLGPSGGPRSGPGRAGRRC